MHKLLFNKHIFKILLLFFGVSSAQFEINENYNIYAINLPHQISFAGENVPLNQFDIRERLDKELLVNTYWQSKTILLIKRSFKYLPIIEKILKEQNIPDDFKYLAIAESGLENLTSPAGAKGIWQFLKKTGLEYGLEINNEIDERYHLEKSTYAACQYIRKAYNEFNNWTLAAASYNMGINGLKKAIELQKVSNYYDLMLNNETYRYVFRIIAIKEIITNFTKYGFTINENDFYMMPELSTVNIDTTINNIAELALSLNVNYKIIKQFNPWILKNNISNNKNKNYTLTIPNNNYSLSNKIDTLKYICKPKDNLFEIARLFDVKIDDLLIWNQLIPSKKLKKNQEIIIIK
ncbi:MAG: murein transglycosylase [Flavobacteriales bacterium]|jgi:membrane-bound lytic murein transglycosylase D|nr:murein transglycosylase [Flavobacteriales bacterium]|tara:strand:+ start:25730 stop:26779 length:1050 start_codon:yes stop_codon:yes gene_type:complete